MSISDNSNSGSWGNGAPIGPWPVRSHNQTLRSIPSPIILSYYYMISRVIQVHMITHKHVQSLINYNPINKVYCGPTSTLMILVHIHADDPDSLSRLTLVPHPGL